jgi:hypothetical protein
MCNLYWQREIMQIRSMRLKSYFDYCIICAISWCVQLYVCFLLQWSFSLYFHLQCFFWVLYFSVLLVCQNFKNSFTVFPSFFSILLFSLTSFSALLCCREHVPLHLGIFHFQNYKMDVYIMCWRFTWRVAEWILFWFLSVQYKTCFIWSSLF